MIQHGHPHDCLQGYKNPLPNYTSCGTLLHLAIESLCVRHNYITSLVQHRTAVERLICHDKDSIWGDNDMI